jgi:chromosomal replication initiation ATPase DnaA
MSANFPTIAEKPFFSSGKTGLGKTFLLNCMAKKNTGRRIHRLRISAYKLFNQLFLSALQDNEQISFCLTACLMWMFL